MADIKIDAMDRIFELKDKILEKHGITSAKPGFLSLSCDLTDLLMAAHNAGRLEAAQEQVRDAEHYEKRTTEKLDKLNASLEK